MGFTTEKYGVSASFNRKLQFSVKSEAIHFEFWAEIQFKKIQKKFYTGPLCLTDLDYGLDDQVIRSFGQFFMQTGVFR
jgi:hypothetical protein